MDLSNFKDLFISEMDDHLQLMNELLLKLEKDLSNVDLINEMMRVTHSIKGASAIMNYHELSWFAHLLEDLFDDVRNGKRELSEKMVQAMFDSVDAIDQTVHSLKKEDHEIHLNAAAERLESVIGNVKLHTKENLESTFGQIDLGPIEKTKSASLEIDHVKVPVDRLDTLMDLVGELTVEKMRLDSMIAGVKEAYKGARQSEITKNYPLFPQLLDLQSRFSLLTEDIQHHVMQARLVPVNQVFARFPRMVRDVSKTLNKTVHFEMIGGDIELDRVIVEQMAEPLTHLLRNAIDHGVAESGKIILKAERNQGLVWVSVEDDGGGIDLARLLEKAVENELIDQTQAQDLDSEGLEPGNVGEEIKNILFDPRLSTKEEVTEISGRGVGLNVLKEFSDRIGGRALVEQLSSGVKFIIEVPVDTAIVSALMVEVGGRQFAIPLSSVDRTIRVEESSLKDVAGEKMIIFDDHEVPILGLGSVFGKIQEIAEHRKIVLVSSEEKKMGLHVDKVLSEQEIIVKPLPVEVRPLAQGFSGATILGNGSTVLIVDVPGLLTLVKNNL